MELSFFIASGLIYHCKRWRKRHRVVAVIGRDCLVSVSPVLDDVELVCRSWSRQREEDGQLPSHTLLLDRAIAIMVLL